MANVKNLNSSLQVQKFRKSERDREIERDYVSKITNSVT